MRGVCFIAISLTDVAFSRDKGWDCTADQADNSFNLLHITTIITRTEIFCRQNGKTLFIHFPCFSWIPLAFVAYTGNDALWKPHPPRHAMFPEASAAIFVLRRYQSQIAQDKSIRRKNVFRVIAQSTTILFAWAMCSMIDIGY